MSNQLIVGIDPDSDKHALAFFENGKLIELKSMDLMAIVNYAWPKDTLFSIEHVNKNKFVYARNIQEKQKLQDRVAMGVGKCQQAQVELCRALAFLGFGYQLVAPQRGNWAKDKKRFEMITGWKGRSNEDTRSAAYFGFLLANGGKK